MDGFYREIIARIISDKNTKYALTNLKNILAKKYGMKKIPTDTEILLNATKEEYKKLTLITKPTRTLSGVAPIALMCMPHKCPHGTCIYCPGGPGSEFGDIPQSYTGNEPSTMRSIRNHYDPYLIVFNRLEQFVCLGQNPEKTEVIIQGGTFPSLSEKYQDEFVMYTLKAMNDFSSMFYKKEFDFIKFKKLFDLPGDINDKSRILRLHEKLLKIKGESTLLKEQKKNETASIRCVGLTIETKPDWALLPHAIQMLKLGCTRVELGVQTLYPEVLKFVNRGHGLSEIIESTRILKDLGFKINYHMMPGLPLSTPKKDISMLKETIDNPDYRPDMYKIYPTMVMKGTPLYHLWKTGEYKSLERDSAAKIISEFMGYLPYWIRVMRVQRDIPTKVTEAGVDRTNLRQYVDELMKKKRIVSKDIRAREAGLLSRSEKITGKPKLFVEEYDASHGKEFFISFEDVKRKALFGYCRLRFPSLSLKKEITKDSAILRELHVVGTATGIGEQGNMQHKGLGKRLLLKAEEIAKKHRKNKMVVISGVGVREYYRKMGYRKEGVYVTKKIYS
ncbi:MAG: tRNA uridine(34) 5-carboxymethylaminomethyl modification radical SAM/GNAT enzyme Elp3 [archaeon]